MKSPFSPDAFKTALEPMFDETVAITAIRSTGKIRGSFAACVMPADLDAAMADDFAQSERLRFDVYVRKCGVNAWNEKTPIQIGDRIEFQNGTVTAVIAVDPLVSEFYKVRVREC